MKHPLVLCLLKPVSVRVSLGTVFIFPICGFLFWGHAILKKGRHFEKCQHFEVKAAILKKGAILKKMPPF